MSDLQKFVGQYVIVRSQNEGVNAGKVLSVGQGFVELEDARRLYYHGPLDQSLSWYEGVAASGLAKSSCVSVPARKLICEDFSLTICSREAEKSIREFISYVPHNSGYGSDDGYGYGYGYGSGSGSGSGSGYGSGSGRGCGSGSGYGDG